MAYSPTQPAPDNQFLCGEVAAFIHGPPLVEPPTLTFQLNDVLDGESNDARGYPSPHHYSVNPRGRHSPASDFTGTARSPSSAGRSSSVQSLSADAKEDLGGQTSTSKEPRIGLAPDQPLTAAGKSRERVYVACLQW
ncbi:hypothetical protein C8Q73DRAFT_290947 [Cubamyces lactineus]|nr:hypothetical protein C8Q73DRAFT_290947 [Cubamyces lactineus]